MITRRRFTTATATAIAAPAILSRASMAAEPKSIKIGNILAGTTAAGYLLPKFLKEQAGIDAEVINFPNITQRMQAIASGDIQIGYGGINAAIGLAGRGVPLVVLSNATDGGWYLLGGPKIASLADLKGKKVAVQAASISHISLLWRLQKDGLAKDVELVFMNNPDMPVAMQRGDLEGAIIFEPHAAYVALNGWGKPLWAPYDTPMGKTNLGLIATPDFIQKFPETTKAVLKAHKSATAELVKDSSFAAEAIVKSLNMPLNVAQESLKNIFFSTESGPGFRKGIEAMGAMMLDAKMAEKLPDWDKFINTSLG